MPSRRSEILTIMLDNDIIEAFRARAESRGIGYQTAINEALRAALKGENVPLTAGELREILRQEEGNFGYEIVWPSADIKQK